MPAVVAVKGAVLLTILGVASFWAFRAFDSDYFGWYLAGGPLIQIVIAGFAIAVDLERRPLLISANPGSFLAEAWAVVGESYLAFSEEVTSRRVHRSGEDLPRPGPLDGIFAVLCYIALCVALLAWAVVIAPLQYLGNLVAGAPVRLALTSPVRTYVKQLGDTTQLGSRPADAAMPKGAEIIGLARKPVATTASISAALLYAVNALAPAIGIEI